MGGATAPNALVVQPSFLGVGVSRAPSVHWANAHVLHVLAGATAENKPLAPYREEDH